MKNLAIQCGSDEEDATRPGIHREQRAISTSDYYAIDFTKRTKKAASRSMTSSAKAS